MEVAMKDRSLAIAVSFLAGATSLAQETIWIRVLSFTGNNSPQTISIVLAVFLLGIVSGSLLGKQFCSHSGEHGYLWKKASLALVLSGFIDILAPVLLSMMDNIILMPLAMLLFVFLTSSTKAVLFPIVHHIGSRMNDGSIGRSVSRIYFANILGATVTPILIGFWLLDHAGSIQTMQTVGLVCVVLGLWIDWPGAKAWSVAILITVATLLVIPESNLIRKIATGSDVTSIPVLIENRHGIIHTTHNPEKGDGVFGGNLYDGRINVDPFLNSNGITRAYLLAALHPSPKRILEIGLSGGAWARVVSAIPGVERMDIVEINPGYLQLIEHYPTVRPILSDPRIHIHIDDGRRWLRRYDGPRFDIIVINNTYHWRAFATNMLSREFMQIVKTHLAPNGIYAFNTTGSMDALSTASEIFPYAAIWSPSYFVYASSRNFMTIDSIAARKRLIQCLERLGYDKKHDDWNKLLESLTHPKWIGMSDLNDSLKNDLIPVSDWNLVPEYRHGRYKFWPF